MIYWWGLLAFTQGLKVYFNYLYKMKYDIEMNEYVVSSKVSKVVGERKKIYCLNPKGLKRDTVLLE